MSYRSGGSRSSSSGRGATSRSASGGGSGWQGGSRDNGWDDDRELDASRRASSGSNSSRSRDRYPESRPSRVSSYRDSRGSGGWDDESAEWQAPPRSSRYQGQGARGWDDDDGWGAARDARGSRAQGRGGPKWLLLAFAALLLVIVVAVIGVVVLPGRTGHPSVTVADDPFATLTPGATPTIPANFKSFQSDRSKYSVIYPEAWTATSQAHTTQGQYDYIDVFALQNAPSQLLVEQAGASAGYTDQQLIQNAVTLAQQNGVTFSKAQTQNATPKVGGVTWARQDYSVNANGTPVYMAVLACHHSGRGYVIVMVSSASEFGNDDQVIFEPMLATFTFL